MMQPAGYPLITVYEDFGDVLYLHVFGVVQGAAVSSFEKELKDLPAQGPIVIELTKCEKLDRGAVTVLSRACAANERLVVLGVPNTGPEWFLQHENLRGERHSSRSTSAAASVNLGAERATRWLPAAIALGLLLFFGAFVAWIYFAVLDRGLLQHSIRLALTSRGIVARAQLDEETGLRGYLTTLDRSFLEPYYSGRRAFSDAVKGSRPFWTPCFIRPRSTPSSTTRSPSTRSGKSRWLPRFWPIPGAPIRSTCKPKEKF